MGGLGKYVTCHISEFLFFFLSFNDKDMITTGVTDNLRHKRCCCRKGTVNDLDRRIEHRRVSADTTVNNRDSHSGSLLNTTVSAAVAST